jgi:hypothetical protein
MPLDLVPAGLLDNRWSQRVHDGCGGEIVIVVREQSQDLAMCCKGCKTLWMAEGVRGWPAEWRKPDPAAVGSRLILPPGVR